jgi:hypothetical protein
MSHEKCSRSAGKWRSVSPCKAAVRREGQVAVHLPGKEADEDKGYRVLIDKDDPIIESFVEAGTHEYCSPRQQTHFEPSVLQLNDIL